MLKRKHFGLLFMIPGYYKLKRANQNKTTMKELINFYEAIGTQDLFLNLFKYEKNISMQLNMQIIIRII
jgi:hypothetical protein